MCPGKTQPALNPDPKGSWVGSLAIGGGRGPTHPGPLSRAPGFWVRSHSAGDTDHPTPGSRPARSAPRLLGRTHPTPPVPRRRGRGESCPALPVHSAPQTEGLILSPAASPNPPAFPATHGKACFAPPTLHTSLPSLPSPPPPRAASPEPRALGRALASHRALASQRSGERQDRGGVGRG